MTKKAKLLWMDLEMTGLDPVEDRILEVAVIATEIPRNPRGKILKRVLREQVKDAVRAPE